MSVPKSYFGGLRKQGVEAARTKEILEKLQKDIKTKDGQLQSRIQELTKSLTSVSAIDKQNYNSTKAYVLVGVNVATSAMSFIPLVGPAWTAILGPIINAAITSALNNPGRGDSRELASAAVASLNAALKLSYTDSDGKTTVSFGNLAANQAISSSSNPTGNKTFSASANSELSNMTLVISQAASTLTAPPTTGKSNVIIPITERILSLEASNYATAIVDGYSWLDGINTRANSREVLIFPAIFNYMNGIGAGGRGSNLVDSGFGYVDTIDDKAGPTYQALRPFIQSLETLLGRGTFGHKSSRLTSSLKKYKLSSDRSEGYQRFIWRSIIPASNLSPAEFSEAVKISQKSADAAAHLETTIALEKARIIAYAEDYFAALKGVFGNTTIQTFTKDNKLLPDAFKEAGHGVSMFSRSKATRIDADQSTHRKDFAIGVYAFHSLLQHHLGTWNLSALLPFGVSRSLDIRVHNALIDAALTHFWICSESYRTIGLGIGSTTVTVTKMLWDTNCLPEKTLEKLPYIEHYFSSSRYWVYLGKKVRLDRDSLRSLASDAEFDAETMALFGNLNLDVDDFDQVFTVDALDKLKKQRAKFRDEFSFDHYYDFKDTLKDGPKLNPVTDNFLASLLPTTKIIKDLATPLSNELNRLWAADIAYGTDQIRADLKKGWDSVDTYIASVRKTETVQDKYQQFVSTQEVQNNPDLPPIESIDEIWTREIKRSKNSMIQSLSEFDKGAVRAFANLDMQTKMGLAGEPVDQALFNKQVLSLLHYLLTKK
jgi:hypothetical protein